jgi:small-conductance mechanosensitive channel
MTPRLVRLALAVALLGGATVSAQQPPTVSAGTALPVTYQRVPAGEFAVLEIGNRPIITFRAQLLSRSPKERVDVASRRIATLLSEGLSGTVSQRSVLDLVVITIAGKDVFTITPADADELAGETQVHVAISATRQLEQSLREAAELRQPARLARAAAAAIGLTLLLATALWILRRVTRAISARMRRMAERQFERAQLTSHVAVDTSRLVHWLERVMRAIAAGLVLLAGYMWLTSVLVLFPYTRPWGEALGGFLVRTFGRMGAGIVGAIPGLFYVAIIVLFTRFLIRVMQATLDGVAEGRLHLPGIHPETAAPTKRLLAALFWLFAIIVSYPNLPGADTDAFKGVSVFLGLVLTLGSSGLVNHMMSGFLLTFTRAIKPGDYIRAGDTEGKVTMVGLLSTKIRTLKGEEVILPNAVAIGGTIVNYSRYARNGELLLYTSVTIGYDAPWRQVDMLLRAAADRTTGLAKTPAPFVLQRALSDFYVEYQLNAALERVEARALVLSALHANIQDAFNEAGVQIMSPHYEGDPNAPKLVPPSQWHRRTPTGV